MSRRSSTSDVPLPSKHPRLDSGLHQPGSRKPSLPLSMTSIVHNLAAGSPVHTGSNEGLQMPSPMHPSPSSFPSPIQQASPRGLESPSMTNTPSCFTEVQPGSVQVMIPGSTPGSVTSTQYSIYSTPISAALQSAMKALVSNVPVSLPPPYPLGSTDIKQEEPVCSSPSQFLYSPTSVRAAQTNNELDASGASQSDQTKTHLVEWHRKRLEKLLKSHEKLLKEKFFLENSGNMVDFAAWKRKPNTILDKYLKEYCLDPAMFSQPVVESKIDKRRKEFRNAIQTGTTDIGSPSFVSPLSPTIVNDLVSPVASPKVESIPASIDKPSAQTSTVTATTPVSTEGTVVTSASSEVPVASTSFIAVTSQTPTISTIASVSTVASQVTPLPAVSTPLMFSIDSPKSVASPQTKSQSFTNVLESSHEDIIMRARHEAEVMRAISELRKEGLWSASRLPKVQEPTRYKTHWDYLLEEMQWLATDFANERRWKKAASRKLARSVARHHQEQLLKSTRVEKEEILRLKKIASSMAKEIKHFWDSIQKIVEYKQQLMLEEKRKKALDMHLNFIVDQTEKYSSWLVKGFTDQPAGLSGQSSNVTGSSQESVNEDQPFVPSGDSADEEETIDMEEESAAKEGEQDFSSELAALQKEGEMPIEDLLATLPEELLSENAAPLTPCSVNDESDNDEDNDKEQSETATEQETKDDAEYIGDEDDQDEEATISEQEQMEDDNENVDEVQQLSKEGEIPIEELLAQYGVELGSIGSTPASTEIGSSSEEDSGEESSAESGDELEEEEQEADEGTSFLISGKSVEEACQTEQGLSDVAAAAEQLQPKGITLSTTKVQTPVPFLLKHTLREYQHIGLDWLVMMHDRKLNGILADEMGLGKTMQTIALLAHLACHCGNWGPHLIVVPTSVMLNWECEFKKWCPAFKILTYFGSHKERKQKRIGWTKPNTFHVCITSYNIVVQDHRAFKQKKWKYLVLDEAQNIKNFKSQRWQTLLNFNSQRRLLLTGTPLQNSLMELWSLMHFLMPTVFSSHSDFREWFSNPLTGMVEGSQEYSESIVKRLHQVLRPFLLRRLKMEVEKQMPKKYEHIIRCRLSKRQRLLYEEYMSRARTKETLATGNFLSVINILMQLRKVCNHPDLFEPRPIVTPFCLEPITYTTASLVTKALDHQPFKHVNLNYLNFHLADTEHETDAFEVFRTRLLQAPRGAIMDCSSVRISTRTVGLTTPVGSSSTLCYEDLHMPSLETLQYEWHIGRLRNMAEVNNRRCSRDIMYGQDLYRAVTIVGRNENGKTSKKGTDYWLWCGYKASQLVDKQSNWEYTTQALLSLIINHSLRVAAFDEILKRFVLVVPKVFTKVLEMSISHPNPSTHHRIKTIEEMFNTQLSPAATLLHPVATRRCFQFPETRLIQYDCGKLQTLDILLRQLKQGNHRVLIFTQMARMLDVLEIFLNYHGHAYLRLDGATPVQKRQFLMDRFNRDQRIFCFILSTRSGGLGVNLTGADTVVFYDSDWNPTMDAQAQDRCHRIGQTRDVHIYRLICESTVEENILKKAHQKKLLGDIAIEGGGFTTEFFQQSNIRDLFTMKTLQDEEETEEPMAHKVASSPSASTSEQPPSSPIHQRRIESLLSKAEDEDDVVAAKAARAEQVAERAEFDECFVPRVSTSEQVGEEEESKTFIELESIESQLNGVEKFALRYLESQMADIAAEQLRQAERDIEQAKKGWELSHLQSLKEEEERLADEEDNTVMLTYDRPEVANKVFVDTATGEEMPVWFPPTPPADNSSDYYTDFSLQMLYDITTTMPESALPSIADYVTDVDIFGLNRQQCEIRNGTKKTSTKSLHRRSKDRPQISETLFWRRPMVEMLSHKLRKLPAPTKKIKGTKLDQFTPLVDHMADHVEWTFSEDWLLLRGTTHIMDMPINLTISVPGQVPNWDVLADLVTSAGINIRSLAQCRDRYINVIIPREDTKQSDDHYDPKKYKTKDNSHKKSRLKSLRTKTQVMHDGGKAQSRHFSRVFDQITLASHKKTTHPRHITDGTHKASLHPQLLSDTFNIQFDTPISAALLAAQRAERLQSEKSQQDLPKHTLHNLLTQGQSYSQVSQLPPSSIKPYQGTSSGLPVGSGFVGQPIPGRRVASAASIAAPIATTITSLARSSSLSASQLSYTKTVSAAGTAPVDPITAQSIPRRQSIEEGSPLPPQAVNPLPAHLAMPSVRTSIGGNIVTNTGPNVPKSFPVTSGISQSTHSLLQSRLSSQQQMLLLQHKMQQQQLLRSQSVTGKPVTSGQQKIGLPGAPTPGGPHKAHSVAEDMVVALLKQQQQQQQAARVNSPTMPINVPAQQQTASQLMKRPLAMHEDPAYTASQLFAQQSSSGSDPHEHSTSQQTTNTDNMET